MKAKLKALSLLLAGTTLAANPISATEVTEHVYPPAIKEVYTNTELDGYKLPYNLLLPTDYDESKTYPIIMLLHGAGERGDDNELQMKHAVDEMFTTRPELMAQTIVLVPQCPTGEQWVDWPWTDGSYSTDEIPESKALKSAIKLLTKIIGEYSCDTDRVYLMGISMGGYGTWDALVRHEELFAAGVPLCGNGDPSKVDILKDIPIWTVHGTKDTSVQFAGTVEIVNAIKEAGGERIHFDEIVDAGHNIWDIASTNGELIDWLFEQNLTLRYPHPETTAEPETSAAPEVEASDVPDEKSSSIGVLVGAVLALAVAVAVPAAVVLGKKKKK